MINSLQVRKGLCEIDLKEILYLLFVISIQCTYYFKASISIPIKLVLATFLIFLSRYVRVNFFLKWSVCMVLVSILSAIFASFNNYAIDGILKVSLAYLTGVIIVMYNNNLKDIKRTLKYLIIGGILYFVMVLFSQGIVSVFTIGITGAYTNGTSINYTYVSIPLAVLVSWMLSKEIKPSTLILFCFVTLMNLVSTKRKASLIPFIALVMFFVFKNGIKFKPKVVFRMVIGVLLFSCFLVFSIQNEWAYDTYGYRIYGLISYFTNNADVTEGSVKSLITRSSLKSIAWDNFLYRFPFPIGIGNFAMLSIYPHAHNNYLELLLTLGVLGFVAYYSIYVYLFCKAWSIKNQSVGVLVIVFLFLNLILDFSTTSYWNLVSVSYLGLMYSIVLKTPKLTVENGNLDNGEQK